jgi:hypothetical protein
MKIFLFISLIMTSLLSNNEESELPILDEPCDLNEICLNIYDLRKIQDDVYRAKISYQIPYRISDKDKTHYILTKIEIVPYTAGEWVQDKHECEAMEKILNDIVVVSSIERWKVADVSNHRIFKSARSMQTRSMEPLVIKKEVISFREKNLNFTFMVHAMHYQSTAKGYRELQKMLDLPLNKFRSEWSSYIENEGSSEVFLLGDYGASIASVSHTSGLKISQTEKIETLNGEIISYERETIEETIAGQSLDLYTVSIDNAPCQ